MLFDKYGNGMDDEYISSEESAYIMEAAMLDLSDEDLSMFLESVSEVDAALAENVLMEKTIVRLDKQAKLSRAQKMAIFQIAKEKNDPKYKKLVTVWKMERYLEAYLTKRYGNVALRRAKKTVNNHTNSKSKIVRKAAKKTKGLLNTPIKLSPKPTETVRI